MKASELIKLLQKKIKEDGDLEVRIPHEPLTYIKADEKRSTLKIMGVNTWMDGNDKPIEFMIMDEGWADALA